MIDLIKAQIGSNGEKGWPIAVKDRVAYSSCEGNNVAVTFLWTMRDFVIPSIEKRNLAIATNFYTPSGLVGMVRNILANPYIRYIILLGEEYSSKSKDDKVSDLTSANAIRTFFEKGVNPERKIDGLGNAVYFDKNLPLELIEKIRENVQLIDLNKQMPNASLDKRIKEANKLIKNLEKKLPFLEMPYTFDYEKTSESFHYEGGPIVVHGKTIPEAWIEMIYNINRYGRKNLMNANTDRWVKEINNMTVVVHDPQNWDLTLNPFLVPLTPEKIKAYQKEILSPVLPEGKAYTYGNKLRAYEVPSPEEIKRLVNSEEYKNFEFGKGKHLDENVIYKKDKAEINQVQEMIEVLKRDPYSKAAVAMTWHVQDELMRKHKSSPCLVFLQAIIQDEKLNITAFFRSHDMTQGWPENAYGIAAIQKEIAEGINVQPGIMTVISGSAQIYNNYYQQVEEMLSKYRMSDESFKDSRGNYIIKVQGRKIIVEHLNPENNDIVDKFEGITAKELCKKISAKNSMNSGHAMYLGRELLKAENALKNKVEYMQD